MLTGDNRHTSTNYLQSQDVYYKIIILAIVLGCMLTSSDDQPPVPCSKVCRSTRCCRSRNKRSARITSAAASRRKRP